MAGNQNKRPGGVATLFYIISLERSDVPIGVLKAMVVSSKLLPQDALPDGDQSSLDRKPITQ